MTVDAGTRDQLERTATGLRDVLGSDLLGVYLFGSATLGGLRPPSDVDVFAVARRPLITDERRRLIQQLLGISGTPRPLEVTLVVQSDVRPWRYPPRREFQYGDWWRREFEAGQIEPWDGEADPDLASLITMVLLADRPLCGPSPAAVLDPVPRDDYVRAMTSTVDAILLDLENDTRNDVLTLARIWSSLVSGGIRSKDEAADWAVRRLPVGHRLVLERARAIYLGELDAGWDDVQPEGSLLRGARRA